MDQPVAIFLFLTALTTASCLKIEDLAGEWSLKDESGEYVDLKATVPGGIFTDLQNNGVIGDLYWRYADQELKWVARRNWTYSRTFKVDSELLSHDNINIKFEGLDTFSTILINKKEVGTSRNMFVQYLYKIKDALKEGDNEIEVKFQSPIEVGENIAKQYIEGYVIPPECVPTEYRGECYVNQLRKMQASYSWDWGPAFPSVGIWKNVTIEAFNESIIHYVVPDVIDDNTEEWTVSVDVYFSNNEPEQVKGVLTAELETDKGSVLRKTTVDVIRDEYYELVKTITITINKNDVQLWWPNGYGDQKLYKLTIIFTSQDLTEVSIKTARIGFRTIELVQDKVVPAHGRYFYYKVNGYPIFMKGSNSVPLDILPEKGYDPVLVRRVLETARDTNMNMIRVWGGGVYESDVFLDIADDLGLLLWHDYMWASAFYPAHDDYLSNVIEEVRHQTKRLRGHACIATIAANNENEGNVRNNAGWLNQGDKNQYLKDYIKLTIDTVKPEVLRITHSRIIFLNSSPTNGIYSDEQGGAAVDPGDNKHGDIHSYQYGAEHFDSTTYPIPRFISEYGLQSYPSMDSLRTITNQTEDFELKSDFMENRNHHPNGNNQIRDMVKRQFNIPQEGTKNYFNTIVYYSQVVNGYGLKWATEHFRRYRSFEAEDGRGYTMGALYWQLNDVWVAPSWASIDYLGRWKVLHYLAREFFAPIIVTGQIYQERSLEVYGVSDLLEQSTNGTLTLGVYAWTQLTPLDVITKSVTLSPSASQLLFQHNVDEFLAQYELCEGVDKAKIKCLIRLTLTNESGELIAPENFVLPGKIKDVYLETPDLTIESVVQNDEQNFKITLKTDRISMFVWLDAHEIRGTFSQNSFPMFTETKTVTFKSDRPVTVEEFKKALTVTNIRNDEFK